MVLTRLSHVGEVCPLRDHSYSDPIFSYNQITTSRRIVVAPKVSTENSSPEDDVPLNLSATSTSLHLLDLPFEIIEKIFSYLTFKNVGDIRRVCKKFNSVGSGLLNLGFLRLQKTMLHRFQATKSRMPRRESARRKHPLVRESDLLETLLMRLSLLQMTFGKHIQKKHCCFFPGEVLDEVHRILRCVKSPQNLGKVFKSTDELFDLTAMAMEYFKDHIEPGLPVIFKSNNNCDNLTFAEDQGYTLENGLITKFDDEFLKKESLPHANMVLRKRIRRMKQGMKRYTTQMNSIRRELQTCRSKIAQQSKQTLKYLARMEQYEKRVDETTRKFDIVFQELGRCRSELDFWKSKFRNCPEQTRYISCECGRVLPSTASTSEENRLSTPKPQESFAQTEQLNSSYPQTPLSLSPAPSVKNLAETWLEVDETTTTTTTTSGATPSAAPSSENMSSLKKLLTDLSLPGFSDASCEAKGTDHFERPAKRSYSDDDDDLDVSDTVGKRVKTRKRAKV